MILNMQIVCFSIHFIPINDPINTKIAPTIYPIKGNNIPKKYLYILSFLVNSFNSLRKRMGGIIIWNPCMKMKAGNKIIPNIGEAKINPPNISSPIKRAKPPVINDSNHEKEYFL